MNRKQAAAVVRKLARNYEKTGVSDGGFSCCALDLAFTGSTAQTAAETHTYDWLYGDRPERGRGNTLRVHAVERAADEAGSTFAIQRATMLYFFACWIETEGLGTT